MNYLGAHEKTVAVKTEMNVSHSKDFSNRSFCFIDEGGE